MKLIHLILLSAIVILIAISMSPFTSAQIQPFDPSKVLPFVQDYPVIDSASIANLKGIEFPEKLHGANIRARRHIWTISEDKKYSVIHFVKDSLNLFFLERIVRSDSITGDRILKVIDILSVISDSTWDIMTIMCGYNDVRDDRIIVLCRLAPTKYMKDVHRAWRANTNNNCFEEISTKGIKCRNEFYRD